MQHPDRTSNTSHVQDEVATLGEVPAVMAWTTTEARALYDLPFADLLFRAQTIHRQFFDPNVVQMSRLMSIKTGGCPEDCGYCSQSAHHDSGLKASKLMDVRRRHRGRTSCARKRRDALLHGCSLARAQGA